MKLIAEYLENAIKSERLRRTASTHVVPQHFNEELSIGKIVWVGASAVRRCCEIARISDPALPTIYHHKDRVRNSFAQLAAGESPTFGPIGNRLKHMPDEVWRRRPATS
jgi:hypothetical protein